MRLPFLGEIEDSYKYISSNSIMIIPLFSGSGMRVKIIEGMALGKVIISTSVGAEGIKCSHNKNILIADNEKDFILEIKRVINNKSIFTELSKNAYEFVRNEYDNLKITKELLAFYKRHLK